MLTEHDMLTEHVDMVTYFGDMLTEDVDMVTDFGDMLTEHVRHGHRTCRYPNREACLSLLQPANPPPCV